MARELEPEEKAILYQIVGRFLNRTAGTAIQRTRISMGPKRRILDRLVNENYLKISGNEYLPSFQAIEEQDTDIRNIGRALANVVLKALQNLHRRHERNTFNLAEIFGEVQALDPVREEKEVLVGLILATDFDFFASYSGPTSTETGLRLDNVSLKENILDFTSAEETWQRILAEREAHHQRWLTREAIQPGSIADLTPKPKAREFTFMRNPDLRRIAERDYRELSLISDRPAWKARLALAGGIIEALLLDALLPRETEAKRKCRPPGRDQPLGKWRLETLINVAVELGIIKEDAQKFTHAIRDYRNLIHPSREIESKLRVGEPQANIAVEVLEIVIEDLQNQ